MHCQSNEKIGVENEENSRNLIVNIVCFIFLFKMIFFFKIYLRRKSIEFLFGFFFNRLIAVEILSDFT